MANIKDPNSKAFPRFYMDAKPDEIATRAAGRPIFKDVEMIEIRWTADTKRELHAPAQDRSDRYELLPDQSRHWLTWAEAFPEQYAAFRRNEDQVVSGTPLSELPFLRESQRRELRALNVMTVEQLAGLDGSALKAIGMNARQLKTQAEQYLARARDAAVDAKLTAELETRDAIIEDMRRQLAELSSRTPAAALAPVAQAVSIETIADTDDDSPVTTGTAFDTFSVEELRDWLGEHNIRPHGRCGVNTLRRMAAAQNEKLAAMREGRAA